MQCMAHHGGITCEDEGCQSFSSTDSIYCELLTDFFNEIDEKQGEDTTLS